MFATVDARVFNIDSANSEETTRGCFQSDDLEAES